MDFLEHAGKVRELLETEIVRDGFDRFAGNDAGVGFRQADVAHPVGNGHAVVLREAALEGAQRDVAEPCQFARAIV